jgi:2-polyprenyl-3-methyl-5-hydroxy-6-metoxy-1,4-benzoquinol methylase
MEARMAATLKRVKTPAWDLGKIVADGERVVHLWANDCFKAHFSIYGFVSEFCWEGVVLDAGCGAGYGAAHLADSGARFVYGIDIGAAPIAFSRHQFPRPNLQFFVMDLEKIWGFPDHAFDLVVSSNALEHIADVSAFFRKVWRLLKADGTVVIVVPPITTPEARAANLVNRYHLNIWSPRQWHHVLHQYFAGIQCYRHCFEKPEARLNFGNRPAQSQVSARDFSFEAVTLHQLCTMPTYSAIFVARGPRRRGDVFSPGSPLTFVDDSFTRPAPPPEAELDPEWNLAGVNVGGELARIKRAVKHFLPWTVPVYRTLVGKKSREDEWEAD